MKHFIYPYNNKLEKRKQKIRVKYFTKKEKNEYYLNISLNVLYAILYYLFVVLFAVLIFTNTDKIPIKFIKVIVNIISVLFVIIFPGFIVYFVYKFARKFIPEFKIPDFERKFMNETNKPLFKFYKVPEKYIVTKCYDASKQFLINKDLLLFIYNDNLRIINDFTSTTKDFGCYEFELKYLKINYHSFINIQSTSIKSEDFNFTLGKRAYPFLKRYIENIVDKEEV